VVEQVVHARRRRFGARRIARELTEKGIGEETVAATLKTLEKEEVESARAVWRRKFSRLPRTAADRARQVRFLQGRGFSFDTIMQVLKGEIEQ
jgi:regulatory protein